MRLLENICTHGYVMGTSKVVIKWGPLRRSKPELCVRHLRLDLMEARSNHDDQGILGMSKVAEIAYDENRVDSHAVLGSII